MLVLLNTPRTINNLSAQTVSAPTSPGQLALPEAGSAQPRETFSPSSTGLEERKGLREADFRSRVAEAALGNAAVATLPAAVLHIALNAAGQATPGGSPVVLATAAAGLAVATYHACTKGRSEMTEVSPVAAIVGLAGGLALTATFAPGLAAGMGGVMVLALGGAHLYKRSQQS